MRVLKEAVTLAAGVTWRCVKVKKTYVIWLLGLEGLPTPEVAHCAFGSVILTSPTLQSEQKQQRGKETMETPHAGSEDPRLHLNPTCSMMLAMLYFRAHQFIAKCKPICKRYPLMPMVLNLSKYQ